jgi:hypothetical protein
MKETVNISNILKDPKNEKVLQLSEETFDIMLSTVWKRIKARTNGKDDWGSHWKLVVIPPGHSIMSHKALNTCLPVFEGDYLAV